MGLAPRPSKQQTQYLPLQFLMPIQWSNAISLSCAPASEDDQNCDWNNVKNNPFLSLLSPSKNRPRRNFQAWWVTWPPRSTSASTGSAVDHVNCYRQSLTINMEVNEHGQDIKISVLHSKHEKTDIPQKWKVSRCVNFHGYYRSSLIRQSKLKRLASLLTTPTSNCSHIRTCWTRHCLNTFILWIKYYWRTTSVMSLT